MGGCGGGGGDSGTTSKQKVSAVVERCPRVLPPGISENLQFHVSGNTIYLAGAVSRSSIEFRDISAKPGILSVTQSGDSIIISNCNNSDEYQQATLGGFYNGEKIVEQKISLPPRGTPVSHVLKSPNSDEYSVLVSPAAISDEGALKPELGSAYLGVMSLALSKDKKHDLGLAQKTKQTLQQMVVNPDPNVISYSDLEDFDNTAPVKQKTKLIKRFVKQQIKRSPENFNDIVEGLSKAGIKSKVVKLSTLGSLQLKTPQNFIDHLQMHYT